ncbi:hypothetical protein GXW82_13895 [Streptacidiphilus sp. 4-A2]|nr:hypothetical protein [Streptacidiphilus sp. 4-A2]
MNSTFEFGIRRTRAAMQDTPRSGTTSEQDARPYSSGSARDFRCRE